MATPNYSYEKRQRELAKKKKNEEKRLRKLSGKPDEVGGEADNNDPAGDPAAQGSTPAATSDDKA